MTYLRSITIVTQCSRQLVNRACGEIRQLRNENERELHVDLSENGDRFPSSFICTQTLYRLSGGRKRNNLYHSWPVLPRTARRSTNIENLVLFREFVMSAHARVFSFACPLQVLCLSCTETCLQDSGVCRSRCNTDHVSSGRHHIEIQ